jgi:hypothetical protein
MTRNARISALSTARKSPLLTRQEDNDERLFFQTKSAFDVLNFNQNLIQFADNKASTLILINSIFIATVTTMIKDPSSLHPTLFMITHIIKVCFFFSSVLSILCCLGVVTAKADNCITEGNKTRKDLVFYEHIVTRKDLHNYCYEYKNTNPRIFLDDLLARNYVAAAIASKKFSFNWFAKKVTTLSCILWVLYVTLMFCF